MYSSWILLVVAIVILPLITSVFIISLKGLNNRRNPNRNNWLEFALAILYLLTIIIVMMITLIDFPEGKANKVYKVTDTSEYEYEYKNLSYSVDGEPLEARSIPVIKGSESERGLYVIEERELKKGYKNYIYRDKYERRVIYK